MNNKKLLSERDICTKFITPAIKQAGWDIHSQIREEVTLTAGRIIVRGQTALRAKGARADYVLYHKPGIPLAVIEVKDNKHSVGAGMQQALGYAERLDVPFALSSNGDAFMFHDRSGGTLIEREITLSAFPSPQYLWERFKAWKGYSEREIPLVTQSLFIIF